MARPTEILPNFSYTWTEEISGVSPAEGTRSLYVWLSQPGRHTSRLTVDQATWEVSLEPGDMAKMESGTANLLVVLKEGSANPEVKAEIPIPIRGDTRSIEDEHAFKMLTAIEKALEDTSRPPWEEDIQVDGETTRFSSMADMLAARDRYRRDVKSLRDQIRRDSGLPSRNRILAKFS